MERAPDRPSTRARTGFPPDRPAPAHRPPGFPRPRRTAVRTAGAGAAALAALAFAPAAQATPTGEPVRLAADGLRTPWEIAPAPDGRTFVVERDGGIRVLGTDDALQATPALARNAFSGVNVRKLLGFALSPDFAASGLAYVYVTTTVNPGGEAPFGPSGIWRLRAQPTGGFEVVDRVFDGIDSDGNHDGGRMVFGPDGALYVTTGDIHQPTRPQDPQNLNGKILRLAVSASGPATAPADNPFVAQGGNARFVWSLGHRHPQGLAFDAAGRLWESEHGPSGETYTNYPGGNGRTGRDELNLVVKGGNYGWPIHSGPDNAPGFIAPAAVGPDSPAWAPGDLAVGADGSLYAPFLAGTRLQRFDVRQGAVFAQASHVTNLGRLRVAVARGSELLIARDGTAGIYRVPLSARTPGGSDAADPPPVPSVPAPGPSPAVPGPSAPVDPTAQVRARTKALGAKLRDAVRRLGARRLAAGRTVSVRAVGPSAGRTTIELRLRSSRGPLLARVRPRTTSVATQRYRVKLGPVGRKRLRTATTRRLVVRVVHRRTAGASATYATGVRIAPVRR
ncbi:PQQ-dependent sugar dehydrogenase [Patulibacter americanus]|uniref:PQQ-dependent sugar dehydrogenase n=1 Tax=Patulibacter americanus TaxID=588672 RepID=UPI0003B30C86|nr:PQQ-dependent sugar dehydrogenase [Patulibacter americanus]